MKIFKIILEQVGMMTTIPDSQRIFGWLMQLLTESGEREEASKLVRDIKENKILCMVSNLLPNGYVPTPKDYLLSMSDSKEDNKELYKKIKKMDYIKKGSLEELINGESLLKAIENSDKIEYLSKNQSYVQKFRINHEIIGYPNEAYSVSIIKVEDKNNNQYREFSIIIQTDSNTLINWLSENKNMSETIFLGSRASQGFNSFKVLGIEEDNSTIKNGGLYLNIGMLLPRDIGNIDMENSYLDIFTSSRRPYAYYKGVADDLEEVISFIDEGSVIKLLNNTENIGKSIENPFNIKYKDAIIFGNSYLMPIGGENARN